MNILIVKLSSLGDVVHTMPAVQDIRRALPAARIDWVVERGFAPLVERCEGVRKVIPCELRKWRKDPFSAETRHAWRAFRDDLQSTPYDAVVDVQGLTKSALVAHVARIAAGGKRFAMANRTEGSSYEAATRWLADVAVPIQPHIHAVERARELCARALRYAVPQPLRFGLMARDSAPGGGSSPDVAARRGPVAFIHGTSRADKAWPETHWIELGRTLAAEGATLALPHGSDDEETASRRMAQSIGPAAGVWPRMKLDALTDRLAGCAGAIGVDSGLSHIAVALDLPHVQVYNFDTAWRTGPLPGMARQRSVYAQPAPSVADVLHAWRAVGGPR
ncbi:lipopolysaccharide heptosyltransferase I [Ramlibacter albus]|uniref:Lipopolysaccharide heptosyltransferase 1 n=1 Tax=Ramlibacter albus TaxID=2079448 RepID=A0A923M7W2_9BURK|nr:lipopolysaccharide heptosyltransferase I [Ramlibacter albus]MBC5765882.1 lipopolysaccharide heptosyltransferase I [Ramlibacter albus]